MNRTFSLLLVLSVFILNTIQSQTIDIGDIPQSRIASDGWKDIQFDDSGNWTTVDVTTQGVTPNTGADMAPAIQQMIMAGNGKTIYQFPAGTFNLNTSIQITKGDFQFIGVGSATKFLLRGGVDAPTIRVKGNRVDNIRISQPIARGDNTITLTDASSFSVGDYLFLKETNGERAWDLDTQIIKILDINGNTLTVDMKIGIDFSAENAFVQRHNLLKNVKFSKFYLERTSQPSERISKFIFESIFNGEISHVESKKAIAGHLLVNDSRNILVFQNNVYGNFGRNTTGGYQNGIMVNRSTRVNVINNRLHDLRHHIAFQFGVNHSVVAYNRATGYNHYGDYGQHNGKGCHNNLFEGNFGEELYDDWNKKAWGSPYVMWFRNHAIVKIGKEYDPASTMTIIGNELQAGQSGLKLGNSASDNFVAANIVNIDGEHGNGDMLWGQLQENANIPNSLFLSEKPDYLNDWPLYGPYSKAKTSKKSVTISLGTNSEIVLEEGYSLVINVAVTNPEVVANVKVYIDDFFIRQESFAPYDWGHTGSPNPDELNGLGIGNHMLRAEVTYNDGSAQQAVSVQIKVVSKQLSVKKVAAIENGITIYPNPAKQSFSVNVDGMQASELVVYTITGKRIFSSRIVNNKITINHQFAAGIYILRVKDIKSHTISKKMIIN